MSTEQSDSVEFLFDKKHQLFFNFINHTDQAKNAIHYMEGVISDLLRPIPREVPIQYMDIGCGYGYKTQPVIDVIKQTHAVETTAIDPSNYLLSVFKANSFNEHIRFECATWEDYQPSGTFHLITSIHTFYYIKDWETAISKMVGRLNDTGAICIAIRTNDQVCQFKNHLFERIYGEHKKEHDFNELCDVLDRLGVKYETAVVASRLDVRDCLLLNEKGKQLIEFLLRLPYYDLSEKARKEIADYLEMQQHNGYINQQDGFVWIRHKENGNESA